MLKQIILDANKFEMVYGSRPAIVVGRSTWSLIMTNPENDLNNISYVFGIDIFLGDFDYGYCIVERIYIK